ncbi:ribosomal protein S16 [Candidatus Carsonella ruddii CS isolate Thao2000]|uniref:30S ribosomal protein S16 n=1 Tax=Candidatus Carsonella ruddii CS isolate Thao2000 TaxID=1202537 RepID=J7GSR7_CARRU|nr:30S ribosomal protein S16 [Candidatus Carsonella ruddii]AFP83797.1 ribosomal protein S16 [Candidatus Carsonella ruddii CS isolate Thao2000]
MIVIRLSKKNKKNTFYYINVIYKKKSVYGKIIKRIGYYDSKINFNKKYYLNFNLFHTFIKNGAKISKRLYQIIKK